MRDPRPLAEEDDASDFVKRALAAGRERPVEDAARERVWAALAAASAAGASTASMASHGAGAKELGLTMSTAKVLVICGAVGAVVAGGAVMLWSSPKAAIPGVHGSPTASAPTAPPASTPTAPPLMDAPTSSATAGPAHGDEAAKPLADETRRAPRPRSLHAAAVTDPDGAGGLREEASMLRQIQTALARGDVETAQQAANETRRKFPNGKLAEERDALDVRIALASGDLPRAARLAGEFSMRYPESPLREGLEASTRQKR